MHTLILSRGLPDEAGAARLRRDLPEDEWRWITRLQRADDRLRSLVGRALTRRLLGHRLGRPPEAITLAAEPRGKPMLVGDSAAALSGPGGPPTPPATRQHTWHFNIAHSGDLVLVGIGPQPLGVDVEHCPNQASAGLWRLITGQALPVTGGTGPAPSPQALCAHWVRREAVLKACGLGLAAEPGALCLADDQAADWTPVTGLPEAEGLWVRLLWASPEHCAALCLPNAAPPDTWTLSTLALTDWIDRSDFDPVRDLPGKSL